MASSVLGSLPFPNQSGDQLVSKVVSGAIAALFKRTGKLKVTVRAEPVTKLLQGSVDGFDFVGHGLLMYNGLRLEAMELYLQAVSLDFSAIFTGQVKLRQPTQASMRIILTEEDLTTSFNTPFIVEKLQRLQYRGEPLHFHNTKILFNEDKSLEVFSNIGMGKATQPVEVKLKASLEVQNRTKIQFVDIQYEGDSQGSELGHALMSHVNQLLDLEQFALSGTKLRIDRLRIKDRQLVFYGIAHIIQFPQGNSQKP